MKLSIKALFDFHIVCHSNRKPNNIDLCRNTVPLFAQLDILNIEKHQPFPILHSFHILRMVVPLALHHINNKYKI